MGKAPKWTGLRFGRAIEKAQESSKNMQKWSLLKEWKLYALMIAVKLARLWRIKNISLRKLPLFQLTGAHTKKTVFAVMHPS
jgi:hypothetical protein